MAEGSKKVISHVDYLIVGAGISGVYCAYELNTKKGIKQENMHVMERLNRTGGLLKSEIVEIDGHRIKQEEGGMRFYKHHKVYQLAIDLGLKDEIVEFKMGGDYNLNYFRGKRFTHAASNENIWFQVFDTKNCGKSPYEVLNTVFDDVKKLNESCEEISTPEDWQRVRLKWTVQDPTAPDPNAKVQLYKWDFEYLLRQMGLDAEGIKMIQYSLGFRCLFNRNVNAGFGFQSNLEFSSPSDNPGTDTKFYTLKCGYDQVVSALVSKLEGTEIQLNSEVTSFKVDEHNFPIKVHYTENKTQKEIRCKYLVLAIPKLSLKKLIRNNDKLKYIENVNLHIDSVISQSMVKINLYFKHQWWAALRIFNGPNYTDLKLGTVYPISPIKESGLKLGESLWNYPGSLTIYCDYENSIYWRELQMSGEEYKPRVMSICKQLQKIENSVLASEMVVRVAMDQLRVLFQHPNVGCTGAQLKNVIIPDWPVLATFTHWMDPEFGDSIHAWKVGANDGIVSPGMYNLLGDKIAIIGESYSIAQEWVEGSLLHTDGFIAQHNRIK